MSNLLCKFTKNDQKSQSFISDSYDFLFQWSCPMKRFHKPAQRGRNKFCLFFLREVFSFKTHEWEGGIVQQCVISAARNKLPLCRKIPFNRMSGGVTPPSQSLIGAAGGAPSPSLLHIINTIVFVDSTSWDASLWKNSPLCGNLKLKGAQKSHPAKTR